jgi:hypothetical protein
LDLLRSAKNNIKKYNTPIAPSHLLNMRDELCISNDIPDHPHYHDCVPTFDTTIDIIAPEEDDVPEPVNFGKALYILSNTRDIMPCLKPIFVRILLPLVHKLSFS